MAITRTPIIDDDGTGTTGTVIDNAWKTELYNQIDGAFGTGTWANVPFNVANFWPGVTAGMVTINCYTVIGKTLFWIVQVGGAPAPSPAAPALPCVIPTGTIFGNAVTTGIALGLDNGAQVPAVMLKVSATAVGIYKNAGGNWTGPNCQAYFNAVIGLA